MGFLLVSVRQQKLYYQQCLSIPLYPALTDEEIDYVIQTIKKVFKADMKERTREKIALIPARGGSKRISGKNIKIFLR